MKFLIGILIFLTVLTSCDTECQNNFGGMAGYNNRSVSYSASGDYNVFYPEFDRQKTYLTVTVDNLKSQDVYFVFSNVSMNQQDSNPTVSGYSASEMREQISRQLISQTTYDKTLSRGSTVTPLRDTVGETKNFWIQQDNTGSIIRKSCTCLKTVVDGDKQLSVWKQNSLSCITDTMAQTIADTFMKVGDNNDIYDWVTHIYGEEWGKHSSSDLIEPNNNITILLVDDEVDVVKGVYTLGYFWNKDNYITDNKSQSNERLMFYMNGNYYAAHATNGSSSKLNKSDCQSTIHSTLAHEFQHMIHFYQKSVKHNKTDLSSTWFNEMCSLVTEDFVADKLGVYGPRGRKTAECAHYNKDLKISIQEDRNNGRLPYFNEYNDKYQIFGWSSSDSAYRYSTAYAFGAYLARNYGGPQFFRDIVQDASISDDVVFSKTGKSIETLLRQWGAACMLSNLTNVEDGLKYNNGSSWMSKQIDGCSYNLGSINLFNYGSTPHIYSVTSSSEKSVGSGYSLGYCTNRYARAAERKTGSMTKYVKLESNTALTIVVR